jgi:hypothetical protein
LVKLHFPLNINLKVAVATFPFAELKVRFARHTPSKTWRALRLVFDPLLRGILHFIVHLIFLWKPK